MVPINVCVLLFFRGTIDDTELVEGLVLEQKISHLAGGISQVEKAKIGLIQFCISPPKTDVSDICRINDCAFLTSQTGDRIRLITSHCELS